MTRETKIGLLVGLAFLLVVGILLSEHITGASDRPAAPLADAGRTVRNGMSAPGAATDEPKMLEPQQPVPTAADLTPKPTISHVTVNVTPPAATPTVVDAQPVAPSTSVVTPSTVVIPAPTPAPTPSPLVVIRPPTDPFANPTISQIAEKLGEMIVPADGSNPAANNNSNNNSNKPTATAAREYKAQPGDTLSRLAALLPGGNVKTNRDAVVALNPTLQKDPNKVVSGRAYLLPTAVAAKPAEKAGAVVLVKATGTKPVVKPTNPKIVDTQAVADAVAGIRVYVVKPGDTLSKIASIEMGSKSELPTLRKLNADVLKGSDTIKVAMKLKLPAKMMASVR